MLQDQYRSLGHYAGDHGYQQFQVCKKDRMETAAFSNNATHWGSCEGVTDLESAEGLVHGPGTRVDHLFTGESEQVPELGVT